MMSHAPAGPQPSERMGPGADGGVRSGEWTAEVARTVSSATAPAHANPARPRVIAGVPYLAVLVCVAAGVYISWHQGSRGGGLGGVIAGGAFIMAAGARLMLPAKLVGFLASRHRTTDVVTLTVFGVCLLVLGLVLPRLGPHNSRYPHKGERPARR
jgi:hypothetical protein